MNSVQVENRERKMVEKMEWYGMGIGNGNGKVEIGS